jgi:peptide/nickel transport system substrate-binding protein
MRRRTYGRVPALVVLVVIAACSGGSSDRATAPASSRATGRPTPWSVQSDWEPPAADIPGARSGGTLTVLSSSQRVETLDPTEVVLADGVSIESGLLVRSLTQYVYDPGTKGMVLAPDLATDLGSHNKDYTVWKFTLREGVRFEDGTPVTPQDVKFGIERSFDRSTFPGGPEYSNLYFLDGQTYRGPYRSPGPYRGVSISGRTITLRMAEPFPDLRYWAAWPAMSPIPPGPTSTPATYKNHPLATGPYKIASYTPGRSLVLVRNQQWNPDTDPGRHQYVDRFVFHFAQDSSAISRLMLSDAGSARMTLSYDPVSGSDYRRFKRSAPDRLVQGAEPCTWMWFPDNRKITDVNVRRALGYAYPYRTVLHAQGFDAGVMGAFTTRLMSSDVPGQVAYNPLPGHSPGATQPGKARRILEREGKLGFRIRFPSAVDDPKARTITRVVVRALTRAGFSAQPVPKTSVAIGPFELDPRANINVRLGGWCSDWPSGETWIPEVFGTPTGQSSPFIPLQHGNQEYFSVPAVDARIHQVEHLPLDEQPTAWSALEKWIQDTYFPVIPLFSHRWAMTRGADVHGDFFDQVYAAPTWGDLWLG